MSTQYPPTSIDDRAIGLLSSAEIDLTRADVVASNSRFSPAVKKNLLRIEAIASAHVDGFEVKYRDLLRLEASANISRKRDESCEHLFLLASKQGCPDPQGLVAAYRYMKAVEWMSASIKKDTPITIETFNKIRSLYDEDEISLVANDPDFCSSVRRVSAWRKNREKDHFGWNNRREIEDYVAFLSSDVLTPAAQAELSHAMLQMIRPYEGRLDGFERLFTHLLFYRRGILTHSVAPLAVGPTSNIERHAQSLISNMAYISKTAPENSSHQADFQSSAYCTRLAAKTMEIVVKAIELHAKKWIDQLDQPKSSSTTYLLMKSLLQEGCLTIETARKDANKSFSAVNNAMNTFMKKGIAIEFGRLLKHRLFLARETTIFFEELVTRLVDPDGPNRNALLLELEASLYTSNQRVSL